MARHATRGRLAAALLAALLMIPAPARALDPALGDYIQAPMPDWYTEGFARGHLDIGRMIKAGFSRALLPILDGNITTMITALVLYEYGTGPIKGFAVTLAIGLVATVFQAVVVTRMLFAIYPGDRPVTELSI